MTRIHSNRRGIALVLVLWVLALLTIIAVSMTASQRTESTLARNQVSTVRFRAAADAGVNWAVLNLLAPRLALAEEEEDEEDAWVPDGTPQSWSFAGETLEIRVFNETSRVDLNRAPKDLLSALFMAVGVEQELANALADAIEDWRDENDLVELNGAEDGDYEDAGLTYGAKDAPFDSVEELQLILGMDQALYRALAPALTVNSETRRINEEFAPPLVQAAMRGISLEEIEQELAEEEARAEDGRTEPTPVDRGGPLYRVRITQLMGQQTGLSMEALVRVQPGNRPPFNVLWRRFGLTSGESRAAAAEES